MTKSWIGASVTVVAAMLMVSEASAHTTSIGYTPGSTPGTVTFWTGSYDHGGVPSNEGIVRLQGVTNGFDQTASFNIAPTNVRPTGLVNGTNNFFWGNTDSTGRYVFPLSTDPNLFGGVVWWQGVTFTGLAAGDYFFGCGTTCGTTAQWSSLNGSGDIIRLTLGQGDVGGGAVPEPATWAMMIGGFGMVGGAMRYRRRKTTVSFA